MMSSKSGARKRTYRQRIKCDECQKEMNSDYREIHVKNVHNGKKIKFSPLVESAQSQLSGFFMSTGTTRTATSIGQSLSGTATASINSGVIGGFNRFIDDRNIQISGGCTSKTLEFEVTESEPNISNESDVEPRDEDESKLKNDQQVMKTNEAMSFVYAKEPIIVIPINETNLDELMVFDQETEETPSAPAEGTDSTASHSPSCKITANTPFETLKTSPAETSMVSHLDTPSTETVISIEPKSPNQPIQFEYPTRRFGNETATRKFKPEWYKQYPWISYQTSQDQCVCFPCREFGKDNSFVYSNWKKTDKLSKHGKSEKHITSMTKWALFKANKKRNTSVLKQLSSVHKQEVVSNRQYLQVIIECLMFASQQNIAMRGHEESRKHIWEVSDINRGNFLELLHLRCKDLPWLKAKLQSQLKAHGQWTSPRIQNELIEIVSNMVLTRITNDVRSSGQYSIIVDETSDISRTEQVSLCVRYVFAGETRETFVGFFTTASTEGEVLYELVKTSINKLDLQLRDIVGECFDGAANMSGVHKGLAARMKECSPLAVYVHCYGHRLNLALQDTMSKIEPIRNALGTIQSLHNFLEASPKRHRMFQDIVVEEDHTNLTLKSLSVTRWSCRWEAVKAVIEQMPRIIKALLTLSVDRDPKTYTDSNALLNSICDFKFVFGLVVLKIILSNTASLSNYLQGKYMDVISAKKTADATIETLRKCRNEESFKLVWSRAEILSQTIKKEIDGTTFSFKDAKAPRNKPSRRLQALIGEPSGDGPHQQPTAEDHYRTTTYYQSLDKVLLEMNSRFEGNDQDILCALADVVFKAKPAKRNLSLVSSFYRLDEAILTAEKAIFQNFMAENPAEIKKAVMVVETMYKNGLNEVLPVFYRVCSILASIPATSCSAERSFSGLRRMKTYLRSTMGQDRLSSIALICIERVYTNRTLENDMESIIDTFGKRNKRDSYFF